MTTPLYTVAQLRQIEVDAQAGRPPGDLMLRAGTAVAQCVHSRGKDVSVLVVCGPGNNGGDGYVCASELRQRGHRVNVVALSEPAATDAIAAAQRWAALGGAVLRQRPTAREFDVVVDAMFGIGMTRPLSGAFLDAARWMSERWPRVVAIDVPSGLDADRGTWVGGVAGVRASETITFLGAKPGLYTNEGVDAAGPVRVDMLSVPSVDSPGALLEPDQFSAVLAPRLRNSHKGSYGVALIVGGNVGMVGAALIAARAALRLGAGRVHVDCIGAELRLDPGQPELMFRAASQLDAVDAVVVGCGLGIDGKAAKSLEEAIARRTPLVVDADGLNRLAADGKLLARLTQREAATVITPHPLEAARLLGCELSAVQSDRISAARELATRFGSITVLKGAGSIVATDGRYWINTTGTPALASAGTGDALAGMIGGLLAQGFDAGAATRGAVWLHGAAADHFSDDVGLAAGEIAPLAARILSGLRRGAN
jgi:ADP-dependent NAD(P)H-hydrate dehydratase / NAD(P)H-hydrate epimerase